MLASFNLNMLQRYASSRLRRRTMPIKRGVGRRRGSGGATQCGINASDCRLPYISRDIFGIGSAAVIFLSGGAADAVTGAAEATPEYLRPCSAAELSCVSTSAISAPSKYLPPWSYDGPLEQAMKRLEYLVTQEGGRVSARQENYLRAELPYPGSFLSQPGVDTVEFLFIGSSTVTFRSVDSVAKAPPPFCLKPGCVNGAPNKARLEALRDELDWSPLETDEDKKWVQIMLH
mmetsp:Transcript_37109/g.66410  ORF Transcript_37109/g.66410 Transcript_37109/m.66410 type:complete len:232 (-) Transcript_37109:268-963(-)